jgi:hypothetical protein
MFSTMPSTGTLTRLNMDMPRRASIKARSIVEHLESHNWKIEQGPAR